MKLTNLDRPLYPNGFTKRDLIAHLLPHHGLSIEGAAMIGDRGADMRAARHHGLHAVGALWGYGTRAELESEGAHVCVASPRELAEAIFPAA